MVNKVTLVGRVGKDPELKHLDENRSVARFSLATNETYKNKSGERVTNTEWHNIVVWRAQAEFAAKYIKKGALIYVEGKIRNRSWDDKDGIKRYTTEIEVDTIQFLSSKSDDASHSAGGDASQVAVATEGSFVPEGDFTSGTTNSAPSTDDLPF